MAAQPLVQFGAIMLHPAPDGRVIRHQTTLGEQLFHVAQRERVAQIPVDTENLIQGDGRVGP